MIENVINLADVRARRSAETTVSKAAAKPTWGDDIHTVCAYARLLRAEHDAESAHIRFDQLERGVTNAWWDGPEDLKARVNINNLEWARYQQLLEHLADLPATTRSEAADKRNTIGKSWLAPGSSVKMCERFRLGCIADDHLFPPSARLERITTKARIT